MSSEVIVGVWFIGGLLIFMAGIEIDLAPLVYLGQALLLALAAVLIVAWFTSGAGA